MVIKVKVYVDLVVLLNFCLDFLLLLCVCLILRRNVKIYKIALGALTGAISIIFLFINISSLWLFLLKIIISFFMIFTSFGYKNIKYTINNLVYLYLLSIILGGGLYFINDCFSYKNSGLIFFNNGFSINWLIIIILTPIILYIYVKISKKQKEVLSSMYEVSITLLNRKTINLTGFLDTGNNLVDPYKRRPILIINKNVLKKYSPRCILVPCKTVNNESMLRCFKIKKIVINGKKIEDEVLVGISDNNFNLEGVDLLLHKKIIKGDMKYEKDN